MSEAGLSRTSADPAVNDPGGRLSTAAQDVPPGELPAAGDREQLTQHLTQRWQDIETAFVDQPRHAVQQADALVAELMQHRARGFAEERHRLQAHWSRGDQVSTEDLRVSLQEYRSFFRRLLSV